MISLRCSTGLNRQPKLLAALVRWLKAAAAIVMAFGFWSAPAFAQTAASSGFDLSQLDRSVDPCVDFYKFACGGWQAKNPLPPDQSRYNRYQEMSERNLAELRGLLEAAGQSGQHSPLERQVGDYYAACMDEAAAEKRAAAPLQPYFKRIAALKDKREMMALVAELSLDGLPALFNFSASPDPHNVAMVIADVDQGGLSLPDRDYYLKTDPKSVERRQKFTEYVATMFGLVGESNAQAKSDAEAVLKLETQLAQASMDRVARRDPKNLDHKMSLADFNKLAPNFSLSAYLKAAGAPELSSFNVSAPDFFHQVSGTIESLPLEQWKTYLRWRTMNRMAHTLSSAFVTAHFHFNEEYMRGTKAIQPRWKRCVRSVDQQLGEASGKLFVDKYFGREGKQKIVEIVNNVMAQLEKSIRESDWMSVETKQQAVAKLAKINTHKLGFPDHFRDYSSVKVKRDDYPGNFVRANQFESKRDLAKIGRPLDKSEWVMTPPTVNAYYEPQFSEIVLPAGILQSPMFDLAADDGYSYGAIGRVIGHELTHGFDDEGRKFDAQGNLTDWWTPADASAFEERASCIDKQYSGYSPVDDGNGKPLYLNGKLTLGENVADNGGLRMAYAAYMESLKGKERKEVDGFTPEQRLFLGYAISRCENVTDEMSRQLVVVDPHSPGKFRLIGPIVNMPEFQKAFGCKAGQPMVAENRCKVW